MSETAPSDFNVTLSIYPGPNHMPIVAGTEPALIEVAQQEFTKLRDGYGIAVPPTTYEFDDPIIDQPRITGTSPTVEGDVFTPGWEWPQAGMEAPHQDVAAVLAERLLDFYRDVLLFKPEQFLGTLADIRNYTVDQYGVAHLTNTTPLLISGQGDFGRQNVMSQLAMMKDWVRNLQLTDFDRAAALSARVNRMMATFERPAEPIRKPTEQ